LAAGAHLVDHYLSGVKSLSAPDNLGAGAIASVFFLSDRHFSIYAIGGFGHNRMKAGLPTNVELSLGATWRDPVRRSRL